jgi:Holliday junction resolvase RusA-like endonuclease
MIEQLLKLYEEDKLVQVIAQKVAWVVIKPEAKQSGRFSDHFYSDPKKKEYVESLIKGFKYSFTGVEWKGSCRLKVMFCFPPLKSSSHVVELMEGLADVDNLLKPLCDAIKVIIDHDDRKIVDVHAIKLRFRFPCIIVCLQKIKINTNNEILELLKLTS